VICLCNILRLNQDVLNDCDTLSVDENENVINDCESAQSVCSLTTSISSEIKKDFSRPSVMHKDKAIQAKSFYRSKYISCNIRKPVVDASCSPIKMVIVDKATSPIAMSPIRLNKPCEKVAKTIVYESSSTSVVITTSTSEYELSSDEKVEAEKAEKSNVQMKLINMTNYIVHANPKMHLGIVNEWFWIISVLSLETKICSDYIKLTLMKIRLNDTFERLSEQFGISVNHACRIFNATVPKIAFFMKKLIFFPSQESVRRALPIPFRANYSHVQSIVDCFEISIHKPSNPVDQALTWSSYKGHNTIKYCISSTSDGFINFVSAVWPMWPCLARN